MDLVAVVKSYLRYPSVRGVRYVQLHSGLGWALWVIFSVIPISVISFAVGSGVLWLLYCGARRFAHERGYILRNSVLFAGAIAASIYSVWSLGLLWETIFYADGTGVMVLPLIAIGGVPIALICFLISWSVFVLLLLALQSLGVGKFSVDAQPRHGRLVEDMLCTMIAILTLTIGAIVFYISFESLAEKDALLNAIESAEFGTTGSEVQSLYEKLENRSEYSELLARLAYNEKLSPGTLVSLLQHKDSKVVVAAIHNPSLPFAAFEAVYQGGTYPQQIASNRRSRPEWLISLSKHPDSIVRESAAANPSTPYDAVLELSRDHSCGVQVNAKKSLKERGHQAPPGFFRSRENCKWN